MPEDAHVERNPPPVDPSDDKPVGDQLETRPRRLFQGIIFAGFALAILGFFLSWGTFMSFGQTFLGSPFSSEYTVTFHHTGRTAGVYGYGTLALAIAGCVVTLIALLNRSLLKWTMSSVRVITVLGILLLTFIMRTDPESIKIFRYVSTALKEGDYTLGYTAGPGLAIIGFLVAFTASFFAVRKRRS